MYRLIVGWKALVFIGVAAVFTIQAYQATDSLIFALAALLLLVLLFGVALQISRAMNSRIKKVCNLYGENVETSLSLRVTPFCDGFLYCEGRPESGRAALDGSGIYVHKSFVCSSLVRWKYITQISYKDFNGLRYAQLDLLKDGVRCNELLVPWPDRFQSHIPGGIIVNE